MVSSRYASTSSNIFSETEVNLYQFSATQGNILGGPLDDMLRNNQRDRDGVVEKGLDAEIPGLPVP